VHFLIRFAQTISSTFVLVYYYYLSGFWRPVNNGSGLTTETETKTEWFGLTEKSGYVAFALHASAPNETSARVHLVKVR